MARSRKPERGLRGHPLPGAQRAQSGPTREADERDREAEQHCQEKPRHQACGPAPDHQEPRPARRDPDALPARRAEPRGHIARQHEAAPEEKPGHEEKDDDRKEGVAGGLGGPRVAVGYAQGQERRDQQEESDPDAVGPALEDQGRQREPRGRSEPDGQGARAECHRWRTTATSHASAGATTAPYHQSAERPATRMLPASEGSAPMSG